MNDVLKASVIGHPVSHSLSPVIFDFLSQHLQVPLSYSHKDVKADELMGGLDYFRRDTSVIGLNVTVPHKQSVIQYLDSLSAAAEAVQAVNVVQFKNGLAYGHNTDVFGVEKTLEEQQFLVAGRSALIYGAGGAARAVACALSLLGAKDVWIWGRSADKVTSLIEDFKALNDRTQFKQLDDVSTLPKEVSLIVNATPLGMKGFANDSLLPSGGLLDGLAFDLVYNPPETAFLKQAQARGLQTVNGLDMLAWQALATWRIWLGDIAEIDWVKDLLKKQLEFTLNSTGDR